MTKHRTRLAAALVAAAAALTVAGGQLAHAAGSVPWTDTAAHGYVGLCSLDGRPIDGGSLDTTPFVWRAVSSTAALPPYDKPGRTATLYAFQPRPDLAPGEWSGDMLTSSTRYTNPAHPMAEATGGDLSLAGFVSEFPPAWDGLLQLRLYLGAPGEPADSLSYAATTIKVTGSTWSVVSGGNLSCTSGGAESIESIVLPTKDLVAHSTGPGAGSSPTPAAKVTLGPIGQSAGSGPAGSTSGTLDAASGPTGSGGSTSPAELVFVAVLAAGAGGAAMTWLGRRKHGEP